MQYYLSLDGLKNGGDRLLTGYRTVAGLAAGVSSPATTSVTIPAATPTGDYFLLVCADDMFLAMDDYLSKPVSFEALATAARKWAVASPQCPSLAVATPGPDAPVTP